MRASFCRVLALAQDGTGAWPAGWITAAVLAGREGHPGLTPTLGNAQAGWPSGTSNPGPGSPGFSGVFEPAQRDELVVCGFWRPAGSLQAGQALRAAPISALDCLGFGRPQLHGSGAHSQTWVMPPALVVFHGCHLCEVRGGPGPVNRACHRPGPRCPRKEALPTLSGKTVKTTEIVLTC
jgi:hypothetical protein